MGSWFGFFGKASLREIAADSLPAGVEGTTSPAWSLSSGDSLSPSTIPMSSDWTTGAPLTPRQISELDKMYAEMRRQAS